LKTQRTAFLLEELHDRLSLLIRLREHGGGRLNEDLVLDVVEHVVGHVGVPDPRFRGLQVFGTDREAFDREFEPV
jgi:hypothetical protein